MNREIKIGERVVKVSVEPLYPIESMWKVSREVARKTMDKDDVDSEVSDKFKNDLLTTLHSPVREIKFKIKLENVSVFTVQQFSRHHIAINNTMQSESFDPTNMEHYQASQRPDRTNKKRSETCNYTCTSNIQGLVDASKKRLCKGAEKEAYLVWSAVKDCIRDIDYKVADIMQATCVWQDGCSEVFCGDCKYFKTKVFKEERTKLTKFWKK